MHISEGVLNNEIIAISSISCAFALYFSFKGLKDEDLPKTAVFSALFFIASFVHIPLGPTSIHLVLNGLIGAFLGTRAFVAVFIALFLQALLFGYGGLSTLGANTLIMSIPSIFMSYIFRMKFENFLLRAIQWFLIGFLAILLSSLLLSGLIWINGENFILASKMILVANIPLMFIEGIISLFAFSFIKKVLPKVFV